MLQYPDNVTEYMNEMEEPVPCACCGGIIELEDAEFYTPFCCCRGHETCSHGICQNCEQNIEEEL